MSKIKPVKAWAKVHKGRIEKLHTDAYILHTTRKDSEEEWWCDEPGEFIRVEIRPVEKVKKEITK